MRTNYLETACESARQAGQLLRENYGGSLTVNAEEQYDIKLEMDVRTQNLIFRNLLKAFPDHALYGEEGIDGKADSPWQWVVDPLDGTVNYFYGIPHYCVSIALRHEGELRMGVIYDPMQDELWAAEKGGGATLNGSPIFVSNRGKLGQAIVTVGFAKTKESMDAGMKRFGEIAYKVRKVRIMGSAALAMAYIACGRLDAYLEQSISLWDIAAGHLLVEEAGGRVQLKPSKIDVDKYAIAASNGLLPVHDEEN